MSNKRNRLAEPRIASECENAFQNGGPKVYTYDESGRRRPSPLSARRTAVHAGDGETVYARHKVAGRYEWVVVTKATGSAA